MTAEPKIDQRRLGRLVAHVHGEEQREYTGEPPPPSPVEDAPPIGDEHAPRPRTPIDPDDPRPQIVLSTEQAAVVDRTMSELTRVGGIYVRTLKLVRVIRDHGSTGWLKRPDGTPMIVPIDRDYLLYLLSKRIAWVRMKDGNEFRTSPPVWVASQLLAHGEWSFPQLEGISDAPVFRADGSIHDARGYDDRTRVIFDPGGTPFPPIPPAPTHLDARRALLELLEPFEEMAFRSESDRFAAVALILSVVARAAIDGQVPMFASMAPTPGAGKGLIVDVCAVIVCGRPAPKMSPTDDDEETRKRLLALATESPAMIVIDNVEGSLGSAPLAMALTSGEVHERELGATKTRTVSMRSVWCCTGNNISFKGDLGRRIVPIDQDPQCEHPEDRTFRRPDLLGFVHENRPRFVAAALTLLRAFVVSGRPAHGMSEKGSFESWDRLVRGAIIWAGGADPLGGVQRIREQGDEDLDRIRRLYATWHALLGSNPITVAAALARAGSSGDLHDAFAVFCRNGKIDPGTIGRTLRKLCDRMAGEFVLRNTGKDRTGVVLWSVVAP
jgi:hypothetical protein